MPQSRYLAVLVCVAGLLTASQAAAQKPAARDSLLDHLVGSWVLRGHMAGSATTHDVTCRWVLNGEYIELHEVSRERTPQGTPSYEAIVYLGHDAKSHEYAVMWMDNTAYGAFAPAGTGRGHAAGDSIPFIFRYSDTERFHNTFVYDRSHDRWQWHLDDEKSGRFASFARVTLTRR